MNIELIPDDIQFAENPEPRCPCVLVVDISSSMLIGSEVASAIMAGEPHDVAMSKSLSGSRIDELNKGIATFERELKADPLASLRVEVAIVTFGSTAEVERDFMTADRFEAPTLIASGETSMGAGINLALDKIEERKQRYRENGIDYYRPWLFLITDGAPTDSVEAASANLKRAESEKRVAAFSVGVEGADMKTLTEISPRQPLMLQGLEFSSMFVWLSQSMSRVSASRTDDEIALDTDGLQDWAAI